MRLTRVLEYRSDRQYGILANIGVLNRVSHISAAVDLDLRIGINNETEQGIE